MAYEGFEKFLSQIDNSLHRAITEEVLASISAKFPELEKVIKWNQPMFTHHGTFIIAFSIAKHHLAVALENAAIQKFSDEIKKSGYDHTLQLIRIKWDQRIDYSLLYKIISYNIIDKEKCSTFWRP